MSGRKESVKERRERLGRNETLFRAVNEQMRDLNLTFAAVTNGEFVVVCECGEMTCVQQIIIQEAEYARVRFDPALYVVAPGHDDEIVDAVVEDDRHAAYLIVRRDPDVLP